jgi:Fe-S-cluster containining protein
VYFTRSELGRMAEHLGLSKARFRRRFGATWDSASEQFLVEAKQGRGCPLLTESGKDERYCRVHEVKPVQCAAFPFWPELLDSASEWAEAKAYCPGIDAPEGRLYTPREMRAIRDELDGTDEREKPFAGPGEDA